jgi:hypothetical protein
MVLGIRLRMEGTVTRRIVGDGAVRAVVTVGLVVALWSRDSRRAAAGVVAILLADRWRSRHSCDHRRQSLVVVNAGAVAMCGGTVTVLGNAIGVQDLNDGDGSGR